MARRPIGWWSGVALAGCGLLGVGSGQPKPATQPAEQAPAPAKVPAAPVFDSREVFPADTEVLDIDLPTALRLANAGNPTIALARQRVAEAYARLRQAQLVVLPDLQLTPSYLRHDGRIQN